MKKLILVGAFCALTFGFVCPPIYAQEKPPAPLIKEPVASANSGYDLFLEAKALLQDGPNGEPLSEVELAPAENLRLQRLAVARNAPALAKLRAALKAYIVFPTADFSTPESSMASFDANAIVRQFARQLWQESAVRAADGDGVAAAQSSLDALELSTQTARGPIINALVGTATASIARKSLLLNMKSLDAAQLKTVADKWEQISGRFPT